MPLIGQSVVLSSANTYIAADQLTAINLAAAGGAGNKATVIPRYPLWPSLAKYVNDNGSFPELLPEYIWDSATTDNQTLAFAGLSGGVGSGGEPIRLSVNLNVFSDNAHIARIDVYDFSGGSVTYVETITPPLLTDGSMDPNAGLLESIPFDWQTIRFYNARSSSLSGEGIYGILVSFTVVNYSGFIPPVTPGNPAGLMFYADVQFFT